MPTLPSSLALEVIDDGSLIVASEHRNNYTAIQQRINDLLGILDDGASGDVLTGVGTTVAWAKPLGVGSFSAYKSSDQTGIVTSTFTKITFDTEEWDVSGWFASSTFSPTQAGIYRLNVGVSPGPTSLADGVRIQVVVYKNGALHRRLVVERMAGVGDEHTYSGSCLVENDGNDTFEVYYDHNAGANRDIRGGVDKTFFQGEFVGRIS